MPPRTSLLPVNPRPPHRPRHRVLTLLVVVLLIAIPAAILVQSAFVSRESGEDKQREAALSDLHWEWPSKVQRRVYEVPIPQGSSYVAYYETNGWEKSTLYVQFRTSRKNLGAFLEEIGTGRSALRPGTVPITARQAAVVGWDFRDDGRSYAGLTHPQSGPDPDLSVVVDTSAEQRPRVYVRSVVTF
ncbi:hypothetical protein HOY81_07390 [Streptomyces sp. JJ36]|nr:hypothetical protein [Streptomyces sp. JJ36]